MLDLEKRYKEAQENSRDDIQEHLDTLRKFADLCESVVEFGVDDGTSTWAWLISKAKTIRSYDIYPDCLISEHLEYVKESGRDFKFQAVDTLDDNFEIEEVDLLFIDTLHTYSQLSMELAKHGNKARKYLIFHDTTTYGRAGSDGIRRGLMDAVEEFVNHNDNWSFLEVHVNNNGLTVLIRNK